jgi:hypothetical protein
LPQVVNHDRDGDLRDPEQGVLMHDEPGSRAERCPGRALQVDVPGVAGEGERAGQHVHQLRGMREEPFVDVVLGLLEHFRFINPGGERDNPGHGCQPGSGRVRPDP